MDDENEAPANPDGMPRPSGMHPESTGSIPPLIRPINLKDIMGPAIDWSSVLPKPLPLMDITSVVPKSLPTVDLTAIAPKPLTGPAFRITGADSSTLKLLTAPIDLRSLTMTPLDFEALTGGFSHLNDQIPTMDLTSLASSVAGIKPLDYSSLFPDAMTVQELFGSSFDVSGMVDPGSHISGMAAQVQDFSEILGGLDTVDLTDRAAVANAEASTLEHGVTQQILELIDLRANEIVDGVQEGQDDVRRDFDELKERLEGVQSATGLKAVVAVVLVNLLLAIFVQAGAVVLLDSHSGAKPHHGPVAVTAVHRPDSNVEKTRAQRNARLHDHRGEPGESPPIK